MQQHLPRVVLCSSWCAADTNPAKRGCAAYADPGRTAEANLQPDWRMGATIPKGRCTCRSELCPDCTGPQASSMQSQLVHTAFACNGNEMQMCCRHRVLVVGHFHSLTHTCAAGLSCPPVRSRQPEVLCAQRHNDPQASGRDQVRASVSASTSFHRLPSILYRHHFWWQPSPSSKGLDCRSLMSAPEVGTV